jgi:hypothetical protein
VTYTLNLNKKLYKVNKELYRIYQYDKLENALKKLINTLLNLFLKTSLFIPFKLDS